MKGYRVLYTESVQSDIARQVQYFKKQKVSPKVIEEWFTKLFDLIDGLYQLPLRHPIADPESSEFGFEIRKVPYGDYLILYRVDEEHRLVEVLSFQHGAQRHRSS